MHYENKTIRVGGDKVTFGKIVAEREGGGSRKTETASYQLLTELIAGA